MCLLINLEFLVFMKLSNLSQQELGRILIDPIVATFNESDWQKLGLLTGTLDNITGSRLLRSLHWNDSDYEGCAISMLNFILGEKKDNIAKILSFEKIKEWLKKNKPEIYTDLFSEGTAREILQNTKIIAKEINISVYEQRIRQSLDSDPALAIGTTKELLESVAKHILGISGTDIGEASFNALIKKCLDQLDIVPENTDGQKKGLAEIKRLSTSLLGCASSINDLRHLYGTGHGKSKAPDLDNDVAHFVATSGIALAKLMLNRHK